MEKVEIDIDKFVLFHKERISLLKEFVENKIHSRLIYQISFLGFESLARVLYQEERETKKRFILLLSKTIKEDKATELYNLWRSPLTHEGFISKLYTCLEGWGEDDLQFLNFPEKGIRSFVEYPPGSIVEMYNHLIDSLNDFFREKNIKTLEIKE